MSIYIPENTMENVTKMRQKCRKSEKQCSLSTLTIGAYLNFTKTEGLSVLSSPSAASLPLRSASIFAIVLQPGFLAGTPSNFVL